MSKSTVHQARQQQQGLETPSEDYHGHLSMLTRMVSVHPDLPQYPNVHRAFNRKGGKEENQQDQLQKKKIISDKSKGFELCKWKTFKLF